jgi:hypothetical protein
MAGGSSVLSGAMRRTSRETPVHSESALALMNSWDKHLIELAKLYVSAKNNSSLLQSRADTILGNSFQSFACRSIPCINTKRFVFDSLSHIFLSLQIFLVVDCSLFTF